MRMQIYEHIYDLSPPSFTHKKVNNLYFFAVRSAKRENLFENLIHFTHILPLPPPRPPFVEVYEICTARKSFLIEGEL